MKISKLPYIFNVSITYSWISKGKDLASLPKLVKIIEFFIGVLSSCKYRNLYTDKELGSISVRKLEADCIEFYPALYAGFLQDEIEEMRKMVNNAF